MNGEFDLFIKGYVNDNISISKLRTNHLLELQKLDENFKVSVHDPFNGNWSKWDYIDLPEHLNIDTIERGYDVHRKICDFEIVIESDYPMYEENVTAIKYLGNLIEDEYECHYYYSGGKSIHLHIFIDYSSLEPMIAKYRDKLEPYISSPEEFKRKFIEFERQRVHNLQDIWHFDEQLIKGTHLIRGEMSLNKENFKTFLGYTHKDIPPIPYKCNIKNKLYPSIATFEDIEPNEVVFKAKWTSYSKPERKIQDFLGFLMSTTTSSGFNQYKDFEFTEMRPIVKELYDNPKKYKGDGRKRIFFILKSEIRNVYDEKEATLMLLNWNTMAKNPYTEDEIIYHVQKTKKYKLSNKYIKSVIEEIQKG